MASWIEVQRDSDFSWHNLPYGVVSVDGSRPKIAVAIGDYALDLSALTAEGAFADLDFDTSTLQQETLNSYASLGRPTHRAVRRRLQDILAKDTAHGSVLRDNPGLRNRALLPLSAVHNHMPMAIGDYTDFFVGLHHALNCVEIVKPGASVEQICPSFYNAPVAYHGRASSVVISGTSFHRPNGQFPIDGAIVSGPSRRLDYEVEFAAFVSRGTKLGQPITPEQAEDHIFGYVLLNDWSARDIQMYEASIMGPFQGKNFCTTISPWIVTPEALKPFVTIPKLPRELAEYLVQNKTESCFDIPIQTVLQSDSQRYEVAKCSTDNMIFSFAQMLAHHTRGGCPLRTGDLVGSGTLSGPGREQAGCLLEMSRGGRDVVDLSGLERPDKKVQRTFLEDGDGIEFRAQLTTADGLGNVGFGVCNGKVHPAV